MAGWRAPLTALPSDWLLESAPPPVSYWTLVDLLDRPTDDPEVLAAREAITAHPPVARLLADQTADGYWVKRDYYLPKHYGTFWVLCLLGDLGLTASTQQIRRGCEFMFTFQRETGAFCRRRRVAGKGIVWDDCPGPCTHARIARFLIQFGYGGDPRTREAVDWLLAAQRDDGMWHCRSGDRFGCLRATLDALRVAALDPEMATQPGVPHAAEAIRDLLMTRRPSRYHVPDLWTVLEYPYFGYGVISALDALARLGYTWREPTVAKAIDYLLGRQQADGTWPLDQSPRNPPFDAGQPGKPNRWLTLDALRTVKLFER